VIKPLTTRGINIPFAEKKRSQKQYKTIERKKPYSQLKVTRFSSLVASLTFGLTLLARPGSNGMIVANVAMTASAPVRAVLAVLGDASRVVESGHVVFPVLHEPVIGKQDIGHGRYEYGICAHEVEERLARVDHDPGTERPATDKSDQDGTAAYVENLNARVVTSLANREKSGMFTARVLYPAVMLIIPDSQSQACSEP
jgi:hypothetical protein